MPSQKTAEKPQKAAEPLIEVIALRKFAVDYSKEELKAMQNGDKENRSYEGLTKMIEVGKSAEVSKESAEKLQDAGAIKIVL